MSTRKIVLDHAREISPGHAQAFVRALEGAPSNDMAETARRYVQVAEANRIGEIGNPFAWSDDRREAWDEAIAAAHTTAERADEEGDPSEDTVGAVMPDYAAMKTKEDVEDAIVGAFDVNLNTRMKRDDLNAEAEKVWLAHNPA